MEATSPSSSPRVSVIIPTYNRADVVAEAAVSVLEQRFTDFELIIVDDGSTDDTGRVLAGIGPQVTVLRQENRGVSAARNAGIDASSGELIAFLDSDDLWLPGKLAAQVDYFDTHPAAVACQTEEIWIRGGVRIHPQKKHRKPSGMIFFPSLALCLVSPSAVMLRRSLLEEVGRFDERLPACEDYDLWLRIGRRFPVHLIDVPLVVKRGGRSDQLSAAPGLDRYRIRSLSNLVERGGLSDEQRKAAIDMLVLKCGIYAGGCRKRGKIEEANAYERIAAAFGRKIREK